MTNKIATLSVGLAVEIVSTSEATIAIVAGLIGDERYTWTGTAKRFPGDKGTRADKNVPSIGNKLALARALRSAATQLERQANGLTKNIDDNRKQSEDAAKREIPKAYRIKASRVRPQKKKKLTKQSTAAS